MPTAWSSSGSLVSDRLRPSSKQQQHSGKGSKGKAPTPEPPKSKAVRALESALDGVRKSNSGTKDPKGGCFCQARKHTLSNYVKMCRECGLILCALNPPYYACPHCSSALSDTGEREALMGRLQMELEEQLAREEAARQRAIVQARAAEGDFPMLPGQGETAHVAPTPARMVLSLNSGTKRVTVSSYSTPITSRPASRGEAREEEEVRVPGPPGEVNYVKEPLDPKRPWKNVRAENAIYAPLPGDASKPSRRKKGGERGINA